MKVVIIEDEVPAAARLKKMLGATAFGIEVVAVLDTLAGAKTWIRSNPAPDLIFMDIELSDGLSLDLAREVRVGCPVIFVTAYDEYWQEAFEYNSIDYLLKPVKIERLEAALRKLGEMKEYFMSRYLRMMEGRAEGLRGGVAEVEVSGARDARAEEARYRDKFLVRRGIEYVSIRVEEIAYFHASHKLVCLVRRDGAKFILDRSLAEIEKEMDGGMFHRVNRKYLVNVAAIRKVSALPKSKLMVEVEPAAKEALVVSSENSSAFKKWFGG
jgi:two-component system LytT family response regulator